MPAVSGRDANGGAQRDGVPLHEFVGGNVFIPKVLPFHPAFGPDVRRSPDSCATGSPAFGPVPRSEGLSDRGRP